MSTNAYRLGLVSVSFREHSPKEILAAMKGAGLDYIEWGSDVHAPCTDFERLNELVALQKEYGIVCSSYGTYFRLGQTPLDELESYINAAKILGTRTLRVWCGNKSGADMTASERDALLAKCRAAAAIAEAHDVTLCMECHHGTMTQYPDDAVWLMREVGSAHFRMYWQPFQWQDAAQNVQNASKIAPYASCLHVFHWKQELRLPLSEAIDEWRNYLSRFSPDCTLLLEFMPHGSLDELYAEADALKSIIGENK